MKLRFKSIAVLVLCLFLISLCGCLDDDDDPVAPPNAVGSTPTTNDTTDPGQSDTGSGTDTGTDSGTDTGTDSGTDTGTDSGTDTGTDATPDGDYRISFVSATPETIALKGTGGMGRSEASVLQFNVADFEGNPISGVTVSFELITTIGDLSLSETEASTNSQGIARTSVVAGTVSGTAKVIATLDEQGIRSVSDILIVSTGIPDEDSFSVSFDIFNPEGLNYDGVPVDVTIRAADRFNNPVPNGTAIYFTTSAGAIQPSCVTDNGECTVSWRSQDPRSTDGRVSILAVAVGEESFSDVDGDGKYTAADQPAWDSYRAAFDGVDLPEAYLDMNQNRTFDSGIDIPRDFNTDGEYTTPNGIYNGLLCDDEAEANDVCTKELLEVREMGEIVMSGSFATISANNGSVTVQDVNGNAMPCDTSIEITSPPGVDVDFEPSSKSVPCNSTGPFTFGFSSNPADSSYIVTVTTPKGNESVAFYNAP